MAMHNNMVTQGIILKRVEFGEADRILTIYTKELGKVSAIAKGARKPTSRKLGHLELGNIINFELAQGKDLYIVTGAKTTAYYQYKDLAEMRRLFLWLEIIDKLFHDEESNVTIYNIIIKGLEYINDKDKFKKISVYELELYSTSGYRLEVQKCVVGRESLVEDGNYINLSLGGIVCQSHKQNEKSYPISSATIKLMRLIQACDLEMLERIKLNDNLVRELGKIALLQRREIIGEKMRVKI